MQGTSSRTDSGAVVYLVHAEPARRVALENLLRSTGLVVYAFASASEFEARPLSTAPACLVLDVNLPGASGLEMQRQLAATNPMPIVFVSDYSDAPTIVRAMKAGAIDFLAMPFHDEQLIAAIEEGLAGVRKTWQARVDLLELRSRFELLTSKQRKILVLLVDGRINKQIAYELGITEVTVKGHRGRIMRKLRASSIAELVRMAGRLGIE